MVWVIVLYGILTCHELQRTQYALLWWHLLMIPQDVGFGSPRQRGGPYIIPEDEAFISRCNKHMTPLTKSRNYKGIQELK